MKFAPLNVFDVLAFIAVAYFGYCASTLTPFGELTAEQDLFQVVRLLFVQTWAFVFITGSILYSRIKR